MSGQQTLTPAQYQELTRKRPGRRKYHNNPVMVGDLRFDSQREANRWGELNLLVKAGRIDHLVRQVRLPLSVNKVLVCTYVADFSYFDLAARKTMVEDVKGVRTKEFVIKKKLVKALLGITIREVR